MKLMMTASAALAICSMTLSVVAAPPPAQPPRPATPPPAVPEQPDTEAKYTVRLLEAGEDPRELRFEPSPDLAQRTETTVSMTMASMGMVMKMPGMLITNETSVTGTDEESGDITYHFEITAAELVGAETADPRMVGPMRGALAGMVGTKGDITITPAGLPTEAPEAADPEAPIDLSAMAMGVILPQEAVGVGGSWEIVSSVQQQGFEVDQVMRVEIVSITDNVIEVKMDLSQTAPEQTMTQSGMTMKLTQFTSSGQGTGTIRLDRLVPEKSELTQKTTMTVTVEGGPMAGQQMSQTIDSSVSAVSEVIEKPDDGG